MLLGIVIRLRKNYPRKARPWDDSSPEPGFVGPGFRRTTILFTPAYVFTQLSLFKMGRICHHRAAAAMPAVSLLQFTLS